MALKGGGLSSNVAMPMKPLEIIENDRMQIGYRCLLIMPG